MKKTKNLKKFNPKTFRQIDVKDLDIVEVAKLQSRIFPKGNIRPNIIYAQEYKEYAELTWAYVCNRIGYYQIITYELLEFIQGLIQDKKAIEIGAGYGVLGNTLNIPTTDRKLQQDPMIRQRFYEAVGQKPIEYPEDVSKLSAHQAIQKHQPEAVVGCWITQKGDRVGVSSAYGVEEDRLLENVDLYIHVGHYHTHRSKKINRKPHYKIEADWLCSRASDQSLNEIRIWSKNEIDFDSMDNDLDFFISPK